uniref:Sigma-70 family RNA polymerase sigma factor n=1 Tax=candidate division WOR-3 bacterium TaxID=2052148 RepID=A0A7C6A9K7_UNCW3
MKPDDWIKEYIPLVKSIAQNYTKYGVPFDDLVQEGLLGLLEAKKRFQENKVTKFSTYAHYWIKKKILQALELERKTSFATLSLDENIDRASELEESTIKKPFSKINLPKGFPKNEAIVLRLFFDQGKNLKEIAEILKISRERVRQLKQKGLRRLKSVTYPPKAD